MNLQWWQGPCQPLDHVARVKAEARQLQLTKPAGSLGRLESVAVQLAGLHGQVNAKVSNLSNDGLTAAQQLTQVGSDVESLVLSRAVRGHVEHRILVNRNKTVVFR